MGSSEFQQKYLYHYTSINALAQILKNKTFLFSPLDKLDDIDEGRVQEIHRWTKYCYISSWTEIEKESIPMWKMYSNDLKGVRIKLPINLFPSYTITIEQMKKYLPKKNWMLIPKMPDDEIVHISPAPCKYFFSNEYNFLSSSKNGVELFEVEYRPSENLNFMPLEVNDNNKTIVNLGACGRQKNEHWDFQSEWRYMLIIRPGAAYKTRKIEYRGTIDCQQMILDSDLPFDKYYLEVDKKKFRDMVITLGPKSNDGDKAIVQLLVKRYNKSAIIEESKLKDHIR